MKRYRSKRAKPGQLLVYYGKAEGDGPDICYAWGGGGASKRDSHLLNNFIGGKQLRLLYGEEREKVGMPWMFDKSLLEELTERGYDITTLKFSIERLPDQVTGDRT